MKIRKGFVSNSSSSSFTCDVCGMTKSGMDFCLDDVEMYECANGHTFCESHTDYKIDDESEYDTVEKKVAFIIEAGGKETIDGEDEEDEDYESAINDIFEEWWYDGLSDMRYSVASKHCPICSLKKLPDEDVVAYFYHILDTNEATVIEEIKQKFGDYEGFKKAMK